MPPCQLPHQPPNTAPGRPWRETNPNHTERQGCRPVAALLSALYCSSHPPCRLNRGAGNILGGEQSGHIAAIGYELYCHLLENAVRALKQLAPRAAVEVNIDLPW